MIKYLDPVKILRGLMTRIMLTLTFPGAKIDDTKHNVQPSGIAKSNDLI